MRRMGKRGPKSSAPGGYGTITAKGYRRVYVAAKRRYRMEHVLVWEREHGAVPDGYQVHHIDGDKLNNTLENLELVTPLEHKRLHSGCELRDGEWFKPCRKCGSVLHIGDFYERRDGVSSWCKPCCIRNAVENKRKRRSAAERQRRSQDVD